MTQQACTVLYVEDMSSNVVVMEALFEFLPGAKLVVARTGAEAWAVAATLDPSLLLLDAALADCRGDDLLRRLRVLPACRGVRAVALSADAAYRARGLGFDECWPKPLDTFRVLRRLQTLLGNLSSNPATASLATPRAAAFARAQRDILPTQSTTPMHFASAGVKGGSTTGGGSGDGAGEGGASAPRQADAAGSPQAAR